MIWDVHPVSRILIFYPFRIWDPGVKKGTGSATLPTGTYLTFRATLTLTVIDDCQYKDDTISWWDDLVILSI
jgi:hypothetical protein